MADGPDDTDQGGEAAVTSRDWRAELAGAAGAGVDISNRPQPEPRPLPASWDPGAGTADPHLRSHARPMATPAVEAADETAGALLPQRLVEALATVIGRRLDAIEARFDAITAPGAPVADPAGGAVMAAVERLDATVAELVRTVPRSADRPAAGAPTGAAAVPPALVERLDALAAGMERVGPAPAVDGLTVAVSELSARLAAVEHRLGDLAPPAGAATVDDVFEHLRRLEPPAGAATAADVLDRMILVELPAGAATVDDVLERLAHLVPTPGAATVDDVLERLADLVPTPGAATVDDVLARLDALAAVVAAPASVPAGGLDLAKVLGGRLDVVVARLVHLEATVRQTAARPEVGKAVGADATAAASAGADGRDHSILERLERQVIELNRILE